MDIGQDEGTTPLTLTSAASRIEGLLSRLEDTQTSETPPEPVEERQAPDDSEPEEELDTETSEELSEEVEGEESPDDEQEETDDEQAPEPDPKPKTRKIKVDGEEIEVTEEELEKGYSRTADYTRKTQQIAEERKTLESEKAAVNAERQKYVETLTKLESTLEKLAGKEPDWDQLRQELGPEEFAATHADWQIHKERLAKLAAERQRVEHEAQVANQKAYEKYLEQEQQKTLEVIPEWKDAKVAKQEVEEIRQFANSLGFSDEELAGVTDHRLMALLRKGMLQERAAKAKPAVKQQIEKVRVVKPGSANTQRPPVTDVTKAKQRLAKTGRVEDAAAALELLDF